MIRIGLMLDHLYIWNTVGNLLQSESQINKSYTLTVWLQSISIALRLRGALAKTLYCSGSRALGPNVSWGHVAPTNLSCIRHILRSSNLALKSYITQFIVYWLYPLKGILQHILKPLVEIKFASFRITSSQWISLTQNMTITKIIQSGSSSYCEHFRIIYCHGHFCRLHYGGMPVIMIPYEESKFENRRA